MATRVQLLGPPVVEAGGERFEPPFSKASALLYYLAFRGGWVARDELLALLWPDSDEGRARSNLRKLLSRDLKRFPFLDDLEVASDRLRWGVETDLSAFREALGERRWSEASKRYRGPLLAGVRSDGLPDFEDWLDLERHTLHDRWRSAALQAADDRSQAGDPAGAVVHLDRLHDADRGDEEVLRRLLRALAHAGRGAEIATTFAAFERHLDEEYGGEAEPETRALVEELRRTPSDPPPAPRPPPAIAAPRSTLPTPATPFVGRADDLARIAERLADDDCRLLTLVGPGGMGKTRLAIEAASAAIERFADGVRFVPLAAVNDPDRTLFALAEALDLPLLGPEPPLTQLIEALRDRELLLLIDNLEQLLDGVAFVGELLAAAAGVKVLATSRQRLRLRGEWVIDLGGLDFPTEGAPEPERFEAVQLFAQSALRSAPDFRLDGASLPAVARITALVAGMALALELAASWLRLLTIEEVAEELEQGIDLLEGAARDAPERHRSIRAVFDASWRLLPPAEQRALRRLAVFRGGFDRRAAADVAGVRLPLLASLVERSLLTVGEGGRYGRHPLIYQVTRELLDAEPEERLEAERAHGLAFLARLRDWRDELEGGDQGRVLRDIAADLANLRVAWEWGIDERRIDELVAACEPLEVFHSQRNRFREGVALFELAAERLDPDDDREAQGVGRALASASWLYHRLGAYGEAGEAAARAAELLQRIGDARGEMKALNTLGNVANRGGDGESARRHLQRALALAEEHDYPRLVASYHNNLAQIDRREGRLDEAIEHQQTALSLQRRLGYHLGVVSSLNNLGSLLMDVGDYDGAARLLHEGLELTERLGALQTRPYLLNSLAAVVEHAGDFDEAERLWAEADTLVREAGDRSLEAQVRIYRARLHGRRDGLEAALPGFRSGLQLAWEIRGTPYLLGFLIDLADLWIAHGHEVEAREAMTVVANHPAAEIPSAEAARERLATLGGPTASPPSLDAFMERLLEGGEGG